MISAEAILEVVSYPQKEHGISHTEMRPEGSIVSRLENRIDPNQTYNLMVHLLAEEHTLRIQIPLIGAEEQVIPISSVSANANISLAGGDLKVDSETGVSFEVNHIYKGDDAYDISPDLLRQLIEDFLRDFRQVETLIMQGRQLVDSFMKIVPPLYPDL